MRDGADIVEAVCEALLDDGPRRAAQVLAREYPHQPPDDVAPRRITTRQMVEVFVRDGFIDRYSGRRLVFPGTLRLISERLPAAFPYQAHWKMSETHIAYWQLFPTIDHVVPVARGGRDDETNWVSTSQLLNSVKSNWTIDELGWTLHPAGDLGDWDGLVGAFLALVERDRDLLQTPFLARWHRAAVDCGLARRGDRRRT